MREFISAMASFFMPALPLASPSAIWTILTGPRAISEQNSFIKLWETPGTVFKLNETKKGILH